MNRWQLLGFAAFSVICVVFFLVTCGSTADKDQSDDDDSTAGDSDSDMDSDTDSDSDSDVDSDVDSDADSDADSDSDSDTDSDADGDTDSETDTAAPNVIYILADDLGYQELGSYGQELIKTPHLDRLAEQGMRFTQHYSGSPVCAPSRGVLLTGKHTGHAYIRDNYEMGGWDPDDPEGQLALLDREVTIAEMLRPMGYKTGFVGKWGLGGPDSEGHPNRQGFDHYYGYLCQRVAHNYYPTHLWHNEEKDMLEGNQWFSAHQKLSNPLGSESEYYEKYTGTVYASEPMVESALQFIEENQQQPFFLVYATPIPHVALQVPPELLVPYEFIDDPAHYLGSNGYLPHPKPRATYAAMISRMDSEVGQILDLLDELGLDDNTIVMFSSDNGTTFNGGVDAEYFKSVGELKGLKCSAYEGGIRVPMIARWPGKITPGSQTDHISAFWDVLPTVAELTGATVPDDVSGISFLPTLLDKDSEQLEHESLYWEYHAGAGLQAVRMGKWKAVRRNVSNQGKIELYDLSVDLSESNDVAGANPDIVQDALDVMNSRVPSEIDDWNF